MQTNHGPIGTLNEEQMIRVLAQGRFGHLGCHHGNETYVVPISYAYEDGCVYMHSKAGKKIDMMLASPEICVQVEQIEDYFNWKSVIARGVFERLEGFEASSAMRVLLKKMSALQDMRDVTPLEFDFAALLETSIIYRMKIKKMTGRFEGI